MPVVTSTSSGSITTTIKRSPAKTAEVVEVEKNPDTQVTALTLAERQKRHREKLGDEYREKNRLRMAAKRKQK